MSASDSSLASFQAVKDRLKISSRIRHIADITMPPDTRDLERDESIFIQDPWGDSASVDGLDRNALGRGALPELHP
jgi:hypothetical protein